MRLTRMEPTRNAAYPRRVPRPPNGVSRGFHDGEVSRVFDGEGPDRGQPGQPPRRPRGRHAAPKAAAAGDGWRARFAAAAAPVAASLEPRVSAAGAWLFERRLHVLIVSATLATVLMLGGAVALISSAGGGGRDGEATDIGDSPRPTSTDPGSPNSYAPILPSPGPAPTRTPTPTPPPGEVADPVEEIPVDPVDPVDPVEPPPDTGNGRPDPPGHTNKPPKP